MNIMSAPAQPQYDPYTGQYVQPSQATNPNQMLQMILMQMLRQKAPVADQNPATVSSDTPPLEDSEASGNDTAAPPFVDENGIARSASFDEFMIEQIRLSQVDMDDKGK